MTVRELEYRFQCGDLPVLYSTEDLVPAFVEWESHPAITDCDSDDCDDAHPGLGMRVRILRWWCFDSEPSSFDSDSGIFEGGRSHVINLEQTDRRNSISGNDRLWIAPVWAVTPVDAAIADAWISEAVNFWEIDSVHSHYEESLMWFCACEGAEVHTGVCYCDEDQDQDHSFLCNSIEATHYCGKGNRSLVGNSCGGHGCDCELVDGGVCDCGLDPWEERLVGHSMRSDCSDSIRTEPELFIDTWRYALESFFRGWRCVWSANQRKDHDWFFYYWHQRSPFLDSPGHAPLVQHRLPLWTSSATQRVS